MKTKKELSPKIYRTSSAEQLDVEDLPEL